MAEAAQVTLLTEFTRVSRSRPCPICAHGDWCLVDRLEPPARAICQRIESPRRWGDAGWLHLLRRNELPWTMRVVRTVRTQTSVVAPDLTSMAAEFVAKVKPHRLGAFARHLGVTVPSLRRLRVGWTGRAWSFPMTGADGRVCGIRLRLPDGRKFAVQGGREGLFVPSGIDSSDQLLVAEGPTDTAALLDLGFAVIGRPSCTGGTRLIVSLVKTLAPDSVVVVADADAPGRRGAGALAVALATRCKQIRVAYPPEPYRDARAWVRAGATARDVRAVAAAAPSVSVSIVARRVGP